MVALRAFLIGTSVLCFGVYATAENTAKTDTPASTQVSSGAGKVMVHKNAGCGCCEHWVSHMQRYGFDVAAQNVENLNSIKERVGVPHGMGSCHTAEVGGYFIEGHVPAEEVKRLLTEKPKAKGLTVPGMPTGSPGMEHGDRIDPYEVHLVHEDGTTSVYAKYPKKEVR
jgi:hypothetical protein